MRNRFTLSRCARRILAIVLIALLAMGLLAGAVGAQKEKGLNITVDAPHEACHSEEITYTITLTNDEVQRDMV